LFLIQQFRGNSSKKTAREMLRKAFAFIVSFFDKKKHNFTFQLANTAEKIEETVHRSAPRQ
jgi:hypothetical protein